MRASEYGGVALAAEAAVGITLARARVPQFCRTGTTRTAVGASHPRAECCGASELAGGGFDDRNENC